MNLTIAMRSQVDELNGGAYSLLRDRSIICKTSILFRALDDQCSKQYRQLGFNDAPVGRAIASIHAVPPIYWDW
ncbi:MAG: hypothetical protein AAFY20_22315 [Cyanobacteria bacterium J06639_14]